MVIKAGDGGGEFIIGRDQR